MEPTYSLGAPTFEDLSSGRVPVWSLGTGVACGPGVAADTPETGVPGIGVPKARAILLAWYPGSEAAETDGGVARAFAGPTISKQAATAAVGHRYLADPFAGLTNSTRPFINSQIPTT